MTGTRLGNWILGPEVGRGPVGVVYKATATDGSGQLAAVKVIAQEFARDSSFVSRFPADLLALRRLAHPNIAALYDGGIHAGLPYYASEWIEGNTLESLLRAKGKTEPGLNWRDAAISIGVQLARALNHGHRRSILHRNLKPSNVMIAANGAVKVLDFGIAKSFSQAPLSLPAETWGTIAFVAPEQFTGKAVTKKSDLYSLGGVLYAALTGRPPFSATNAAEYLHKHCYTLPDRPGNFVSKLPNEFDELVCTLLAKDPSRRPAVATSVVDELDKLRGKLERKGDRVTWPADPGDTALHAPLSDTTVAESEGEEGASGSYRERSLLARPIVVIPLFLLVLGAILFLLFRPGPSAEELYHRAEPLMTSQNPTDWDRAWDEYLEPLSRKFPDQYVAEVQAFRERRSVLRELNKAIDQGHRVRYTSDAERFYTRGLALMRVGDVDGARAEWEKAIKIAEREERWGDYAREAIRELAKPR
ncbi:MAG: serine/threonine-protein kinase [Gemmataceae bacterium]